MSILKLIGDPRVAVITKSFGNLSGGSHSLDRALDVGAKVAPVLGGILSRDVGAIDVEYIESLAASLGFDLAGAAGPIAQLLQDEGAGFQGSLLQFFASPQGKQFLLRFFRGGRFAQPTQCPECGYVSF